VIRSTSPQRPDDVVAETAETTAEGVAAAAARARKAGRDWAAASASERAATLVKAADAVAGQAGELAGLIVREVGKPRTEAAGEVARVVGILRYYSQQCLAAAGDVLPGAGAGSLVLTTARPRGVAGLITPWNFPAAIPMWKAAPALAYGNAVLLKPASPAFAVGQALERILGGVLPADLFTVLPGNRVTAEAIIDAADVVSFTGSTEVGRAVAARAAGRNIACQAEMGGTNVSVITPSADLRQAARDIAAAAFGYAGQKCTATSHVVVVGDRPDAVPALVEAAAAVRVGEPDDPATASGPLIDADAAQQVAAAWEQASAGGARLLAEVGDRSDGAWQPLRLVAGAPADSRLECEEVFGPIATVRTLPSLADAVEWINGQRYGLVSAVYTADLGEAFRFGRQVRTGLVKVNAPTTGVDYWAPFGGDKDSSHGPREQGTAARALYTTTQTLTLSGLG
jgi:aldehyde dehydrogenase (NAD+)